MTSVAPEITFAAESAAVAAGAAGVMDVLIRVAVTRGERAARRPPLNVALAVDRSGSMRGDKL